MNLTALGVFCLLIGVQCRSARHERWNALDLTENRDLFLSAMQAYFGQRGIHVDRAAPSFILLSTKTRNNRNSDPDEDDFLEAERDPPWL